MMKSMHFLPLLEDSRERGGIVKRKQNEGSICASQGAKKGKNAAYDGHILTGLRKAVIFNVTLYECIVCIVLMWSTSMLSVSETKIR